MGQYPEKHDDGSAGNNKLAKPNPPCNTDRGSGRDGRDGIESSQIASNRIDLVFTGRDGGRLIPYEGPLGDAWAKGDNAYRLYPSKTPFAERKSTVTAVKEQLPQMTKKALLQRGVRWITQFGSQVVGFAQEDGHPTTLETLLTSGELEGEKLTAAVNGPHRTSFSAFQGVSEIAAIVEFLRRHLSVVSVEVRHTLRVEERVAKEGNVLIYERSAGTREAVLDEAPFWAAALFDGRRCANVVVVLHASPQNTNENYLLFRCRGVRKVCEAGRSRLLRVVHSNGRCSVVFPNDAASPSYTCYEVRHVIKVEGSMAEVHVVKAEEYGSSDSPVANPVRVEVRGGAAQDDWDHFDEEWNSFIELSSELCRLLALFVTVNCASVDHIGVPQLLCIGDSADAPCSRPDCNRRHRFTMCMRDAWKGCSDARCNYRHGFSKVGEVLKYSCSELVPASSNFSAMGMNPHLFAQLRSALSMQLLRIRDLASKQPFGAYSVKDTSAECSSSADQLAELIKQYNAIVHSFHKNTKEDLAFCFRCCHRLKSPLPLLAARDEVREACLKGRGYMLVDSPTGSGKSTQLPQYLAECAAEQLERNRRGGFRVSKQKLVICVEPRALAAMALADYVAREYDDPAVSTRKRVYSPSPYNQCLRKENLHIVYTTERILLRLMRSGQINLAADVYAVVLDEAHERTIAGDMLLGILKTEMQRTNFAFQLVVCSATLQMSAFGAYLPGARHISVGGRTYPVEVVYAGRRDKVNLESNYVQETVDAVISILKDPPTVPKAGAALDRTRRHILAFLPAAADVETAHNLLTDYIAKRVEVAPTGVRSMGEGREQCGAVRVCTISGRQNASEQRNAFITSEAGEQKVIFATSVAETSVTIDGVGYVVDCGLSRLPHYDPVRHLTKLVVCPVTQSSAVQRAGRAGRTGPGVCVRLYTQTCFNLFEKHKPPAVKAAPLHTVVLQLAQMHYSMLTFDWIDKPERTAIEATLEELTLHCAFESAKGGGVGPLADGGVPPTLSPFGQFLLDLDDVSVPLARLLYVAKEGGNGEFLGFAALTAATIRHFPSLFYYPKEERCDFFLQLRDYGQKYAAATRGDVICAVQLVAAALHKARPTNTGSTLPAAAPKKQYFGRFALKCIRQSQWRLYRSAVMPMEARGDAPVNVLLPNITPAVVEAYADEMQKLLARCFCLQVAVHCGDEEMRYETIGAARQECLLTGKSFMKQQHLLLSGSGGGVTSETQPLFDPYELPDICVFCSLLLHSPTCPGVISLCTPVQMEWLPDSVQEKVRQIKNRQFGVWRVALSSVHLNEWQPQEVARWLSGKLNGIPCEVAVNETSKQLSLFCPHMCMRAAAAALSRAVHHADERHEQTCREVALHGFCRVTWKTGCVKGEVLRDKDEYVTLQFSGACEASISCLELDLPDMVEEWSQRWFGRPMLVTVRSGSGGAAPASGRWTALVTFTNSHAAHDFFERFEVADETERPFVVIEPYCEQEPYAASVDSSASLCCINLRLCVGHEDPESGSAGVRRVCNFPIERVAEFQRMVRAALPDGVTTESQLLDQSEGILYMQFLAVDQRAADTALAVLHRIRGPSIHYRSLFIDTAYSAEYPLPSLANKSLQRLLQERVKGASGKRYEEPQGCLHCSTLYTHSNRSLLLRCTSSSVLQRALQFLRDSSVVNVLSLCGESTAQQVNKARILATQVRHIVKRFNAVQMRADDSIYECQFQFCELDGKLCFIGPERSFKRVQDFIDKTRSLFDVDCTTLTLPSNPQSASMCRRWLDELAARCLSNHNFVRVIRDRSNFVFIAPPRMVQLAKSHLRVAALWRAIDGVENEHYDPHLGEVRRHRRVVSTDGVSEHEEVEKQCSLCYCEVQVDNILLICGHRFCTACLAGAFNTEGGAVPEPPIRCVCCEKPISATELGLFAPRIGLRRLGELVRSRMVAKGVDNQVELKECPNKICLGVPKVVTYANRKCSGCGLAYCEVCVGNGKMRPWHDGKHITPADLLVDKLIDQLPLLPKCPQCSVPFYDFDGCFALSCPKNHGICGFCMQDCGNDAHSHVRQCKRNPGSSYHALISVFFRCRAEDLADKMREVLVDHPALSVPLVETFCSKVKSLMSDKWPKDPIETVEAELLEAARVAQTAKMRIASVSCPTKQTSRNANASPDDLQNESGTRGVGDLNDRVAQGPDPPRAEFQGFFSSAGRHLWMDALQQHEGGAPLQRPLNPYGNVEEPVAGQGQISRPAQAADVPFHQVNEPDPELAQLHKTMKETAADAAQELAMELGGFNTSGFSMLCADQYEVEDLSTAAEALRGVCAADLSDAVEEALLEGRSVEGAAVWLYAFYDVDRRIEIALRSLGMGFQACPGVVFFLRILLRGLQLAQVNAPQTLKRTARLTAAQLALYNDGGLIVWDAPTCCDPISGQRGGSGEGGDMVTFLVQSSTYTEVRFSSSHSIKRFVLPAGARLRVTKVEERVIDLQQESDFGFKI